jgi:hypothetical protein
MSDLRQLPGTCTDEIVFLGGKEAGATIPRAGGQRRAS